MWAKTQIGGKYDRTDSSVFDLKRQMQGVGIEVSHPMSDGIISTVDGRGYTFDPSKISFLEVEADYYRSIATSDFHTVNNRFQEDLGYVGGSASLEMAYAMVKRRPILLMHRPRYAASADPLCIEILTEREDLMHVHDLAAMDGAGVRAVAESIKGQEVDYGLTEAMGRMVLERVDALFEDIRNNPL